MRTDFKQYVQMFFVIFLYGALHVFRNRANGAALFAGCCDQFIVFIFATIIFFDAQQLGIQRDVKQKGFFKAGPVGWAVLNLSLLIIFLPVYLYRRKRIANIKDTAQLCDSVIGINFYGFIERAYLIWFTIAGFSNFFDTITNSSVSPIMPLTLVSIIIFILAARKKLRQSSMFKFLSSYDILCNITIFILSIILVHRTALATGAPDDPSLYQHYLYRWMLIIYPSMCIGQVILGLIANIRYDKYREACANIITGEVLT